MKSICPRSLAVGVLLALVAVLAISEALAQRHPMPPVQPPVRPAASGKFQISSGPGISQRACLYALDESTGDLYCLDTPQSTGTGPNWNVSYAGNINDLVARLRR